MRERPCPASFLVDLLGKLYIANEPASDLESVGSTDPFIEPIEMLIDSDDASTDAFPGDVVIIDAPLPPVTSGANASIIAEVKVANRSGDSVGAAQDPLRAALQGPATLVAADTDGAALEAFRVSLLNSTNKLAAMRRRAEACQCKIDRIAGGTPAAGEPSRASTVRQRGATIASMLGVGRPVYATPMENLRAAQAAAEELDNLEDDEQRSQMAHLQELLARQLCSKMRAAA